VTRVGHKWGYIDVDVSEHKYPLRTEWDKRGVENPDECCFVAPG